MGEYADELTDNGIMDEWDDEGISLSDIPWQFKYDVIQKETEKAFLLVFKDVALWFPKTQISIRKENNTMEVPAWLGAEKLHTERLPREYRLN